MPTSQENVFDGESHRQRAMAEGFGAEAERYDRARPRYPRPLIDQVAALGRDLLDVGCGTGIAARQFRDAGCAVLGVDVDDRMVDRARSSGIRAEVSAFEEWDPAGRRFDVVTAAQTWHWIDPDRGAAKARQVLRPGGSLALFWNVTLPGPEVRSAFSAVHRRVMPEGVPDFWAQEPAEPYRPFLDAAAGGLSRTGGFDEPVTGRHDWEHVYERDAWLDQLPTSGLAGRLPPEVMTRLGEETGAAIDGLGGSFVMPYVTVILTARRP